jgi:hypothetical protein
MPLGTGTAGAKRPGLPRARRYACHKGTGLPLTAGRRSYATEIRVIGLTRCEQIRNVVAQPTDPSSRAHDQADHDRSGEESVLAGNSRARAQAVQIENIGIVLHARFGVSLPEDLNERLQELSQDELDEMLSRSAIAATAAEALMVRLKHLRSVDVRTRPGANKGRAR